MSTTIQIEDAQRRLARTLLDMPRGERVRVVDASRVLMGCGGVALIRRAGTRNRGPGMDPSLGCFDRENQRRVEK
jgi:hypothetical protein